MPLMEKLDTLVIGDGAREHAIGWKCSFSPRCGKLYFLPGNAGTSRVGTNIVMDVPPTPQNIAALARSLEIDLVIVGPEGPLEEGVVDALRAHGIAVAGPTKRTAQLETSKAFAKRLLAEYRLPTAPFVICDDYTQAIERARFWRKPFFVKANGLCLGQGAFPCYTTEEAQQVIHRLMRERVLGAAGAEILIEEFLSGEEASAHAFCGGRFALAPFMQDHKRLLPDGEFLPNGTNPNTGGMGAVGPLPWMEEHRVDIEHLVKWTLRATEEKLGEPFLGILYPGFMMTPHGPYILEYNVRGGNPEMQVLMQLLKSDAVDLFEALATGTLEESLVEWHTDRYAVAITLAARGYPESPRTGDLIDGIEQAEAGWNVRIFHGATRLSEGRLYTNGGRVLTVTATGPTLEHALAQAYRAVDLIHFEGMHFRSDIGQKAVERARAPAA